MSNKLTIYANDLDWDIGVSTMPVTDTYKYVLEVERKTAFILALDEWQFWPAREELKKEFNK